MSRSLVPHQNKMCLGCTTPRGGVGISVRPTSAMPSVGDHASEGVPLLWTSNHDQRVCRSDRSGVGRGDLP